MTIKELRESQGLTQKELAGRLGRPVGTIRNWEQGRSMPSAMFALQIADIFDVVPSIDRERNVMIFEPKQIKKA